MLQSLAWSSACRRTAGPAEYADQPASRDGAVAVGAGGTRGFYIDQECELKASGDSGAVVRYGRHPLDIEEVRQHIEQGKLPTKLALTFDGRVSFVLTDGLRLRSIQLQDVARDDDGADPALMLTWRSSLASWPGFCLR